MTTIRKAEFDHMPAQVATEILCKPGARITNKERKTLMRARETRYESALPSRESRHAEILSNRLKGRTWAQLIKWDKRCKNARALVQHAFVVTNRRIEKLGAKTDKPNQTEVLALLLMERQKAALELQSAKIELAWDCVTGEIKRRTAAL